MKFNVVSASAAAILALIPAVIPAAAYEADYSENGVDVVPGAYIVEWETDIDTSSTFYRDIGLSIEHRMDFKYRLFKGASFKVTNTTVAAHGDIAAEIAARPEVRAVWPVRTIHIPTPKPVFVGKKTTSATSTSQLLRNLRRQNGEPDVYAPHVMTQVDRLRAEGYTGKGIRIGVVDSGIDYTHPALGGCFGEGCLVAYGRDLTGDDYFPPESPSPDADPYDGCVGHGTHVAGIIAAQVNEMGFTGAAPDVTIGAYRAWGCGQQTTNDVLLAGFNAAFEDGSDLISCSAGYYTGWATDPWGIVASRIAAQGVPVIVAPGNSGSSGMWLSAFPATGVNVTAVGSVDNVETPHLLAAASYSVGNSTVSLRAFGFLGGGPAYLGNVTLPLWAVGNDTSTDDACKPLPDSTPDLSSKVVLLRVADTSNCYSSRQAINIAAKGGKYLLFYGQRPNADSDYSSITRVYAYEDGILGVGSVTPTQGAQWIRLLGSGAVVNVNIVDPEAAGVHYEAVHNDVSGGLTSLSTAWGPTWEAESKPQFTAPGGNILSTWPVVMGEYSVLSGTSMSTPLAAAVFALVSQARGTTDPVELRNVISSTSRPRSWFNGTTVHDIFAPVPQQGAGAVQAYDAAHAKTVLSTSQISFNDTANMIATQRFSIRNTGEEELVYTLGHARAATVYTFAPGSRSASQFPNPTVDEWAELAFSADTITVGPGSLVEVEIAVTQPQTVNAEQLPVYSGFITLEANNSESHSLPYMGVAGNLKDVPVFLQGPEYGTFLGYANNPTPPNTTFTIPRPGSSSGGGSFPSMLANLLFGSQVVRADVVALTDAGLPTTNFFGVESVGFLPGFPEPWVIRRGYRLAFGGQLADGTVVPEGTYKIVFSALRVFGDPEVEGDWDFAETVPFVTKYID
ncbi:subtilisin-like serine protease pr1c [Colletotrichum sojae]|uniref:Subtilisin-like serine protease pr1c n=1 Tax=Colletotrichum sojae TaxID=2175907 RepID=A0A8H6IMT9_9PEZI|nr:subtilisin-like serine protease pr1c [Colletotrichum sojae]